LLTVFIEFSEVTCPNARRKREPTKGRDLTGFVKVHFGSLAFLEALKNRSVKDGGAGRGAVRLAPGTALTSRLFPPGHAPAFSWCLGDARGPIGDGGVGLVSLPRAIA